MKLLEGIRSRNRHKQELGSHSINDYEIGRHLGRGGFGHVYEVRSKMASIKHLPLAMKMIEKRLIQEAGMASRVRNEVEIHWNLKHPNILELYNFFEDDSHVYLVMELCSHGELFRFLQKLADFGLAVKLNEPDGEQKTMCGTPNYISPEIISRKPYGLASDVWSLGCMMFTLLVGYPPFESNAVKSTLAKVSKVDYAIPNWVGAEARDLIEGMLQKDPKHRIPIAYVLNHPFFKHSIYPLNQSSAPFQQNQARPPVAPVAIEVQETKALPFSTVRLRPLKQETKHGSIEILNSGKVLVHFHGDDYMLLINSDGTKIDFHAAHQECTSKTLISSYHVDTLPIKYAKKYRYAARFIEAVRSKTAKVIYYSPQAKCTYMENGSLPDIEAAFFNDIKLHWSPSTFHVSIKKAETCLFKTTLDNQKYTHIRSPFELDTVSSPLDAIIPSQYFEYWQHTLECYKQCFAVDLETCNADYPIVLKSGSNKKSMNLPDDLISVTSSVGRPPASVAYSEVSSAPRTPSSPLNRQMPSPSTKSHKTHHTGRPPLAPTDRDKLSHYSQPVTSPSVVSNTHSNNWSPKSLPSLNHPTKSVTAPWSLCQDGITLESKKARNWENQSQISGGILHRSDLENNLQETNKMKQEGLFVKASEKPSRTEYRFMPEVGWCIQSIYPQEKQAEQSEFTMLFTDGCKLVIETPSDNKNDACYLRFSEHQEEQRLKIDKKLPSSVKKRLSYFPKFVALFQK